MANRKRSDVDEVFIIALKKKFEEDRKKLDASLHHKNWQTQFSTFINEFIHNDLSKDSTLYIKTAYRSNGAWPSSRTIYHAFIKGKKASHDLIDVCGWYVFGQDWKIHRNYFIKSETEVFETTKTVNFNLKNLKISLEPGTAPKEEIAELLLDISRLYQLTGGSGINYQIEGVSAQKLSNHEL